MSDNNKEAVKSLTALQYFGRVSGAGRVQATKAVTALHFKLKKKESQKMKTLTVEKINELWCEVMHCRADFVQDFAHKIAEYLAEPEPAKPKIVNQALEDLLWVPKDSEEFYTIRGVTRTWWGTKDDYNIINSFDIFKTREQAAEAKERDAAILECNKQAARLILSQHPGWVADFNNRKQPKYFPAFAYDDEEIAIYQARNIKDQWTFIDAPEGIWEQIDDGLIRKAMGIEV